LGRLLTPTTTTNPAIQSNEVEQEVDEVEDEIREEAP
jgi:hypothetical protein